MNAKRQKIEDAFRLRCRLMEIAPKIDRDDIYRLRRAAITLHGWYEHECNGTIQRDLDTGIPYWHTSDTGKRWGRTDDREKGAERTIKAICEAIGLHYYLQTDPRGGTLYVSDKPIDDNRYSTTALLIA